MAEKNILMQKKKADGTFDIYYPRTKAENIIDALATQAEAEAGVNNTKFMTPLRVKQVIDAQYAKPGSTIIIANEPDEKMVQSSTSGIGATALTPLPGKYRATGEIRAVVAGSATPWVVLMDPFGRELSPRFSNESETYAQFTIDAEIPVGMFTYITLAFRSSKNGTNVMGKNFKISYSPGLRSDNI